MSGALSGRDDALSVLESVVAAAGAAPRLGDALPCALELIRAHLGWQVGHAYVPAGERDDELVCSGIWSLSDDARFAAFRELSAQLRPRTGDDLAGLVLASGEPLWIADVGADPGWPRAAAARRSGLRGGFGFALLRAGKVAGVLEFFTEGTAAPSGEQQRMMGLAGTLVGALIERDVAAREPRGHSAELAQSGCDREARLCQAERLTSLGRLAAGIAHDFGNLLTVILNYSEVVAARLPPSMAPRDEVEEIRRAAQRASALTHTLLGFARAQAPRREPVELDVLVDDLRNVLLFTLGEEIELITRHGADLWPIDADRAQIEQIVFNLVVNARDAIDGRGRLTIETANIETEEGDASSAVGACRRHHVRLRVSDTGRGMCARVAARACEPFFSTKPPQSGTGLGLASVHDTVMRLGGRLELRSEVGTGTTVVIELPAAVAVTGRE